MSLWEDCIYWPAAGFSSEVRAGVDPLKTSPARKCRARGRIEQTLLDEDVAPTDLRPSPATPTYHIKVPNVSIYDKAPEPCSKARTPARLPRRLLLQHESNLHIDLVALYVAVLYQDVLVLDPRAFNTPKRLGSTSDGLVYGILEARL